MNVVIYVGFFSLSIMLGPGLYIIVNCSTKLTYYYMLAYRLLARQRGISTKALLRLVDLSILNSYAE